MQFPYLDFNGTDGSDPALVHKVYSDGTRIALTDIAAIAAKDADEQQVASDNTTLRDRIVTGRAWIESARGNLATALTAGGDGYSAGEVRAVLDLLINNQNTELEILDKLLAVLSHQVS